MLDIKHTLKKCCNFLFKGPYLATLLAIACIIWSFIEFHDGHLWWAGYYFLVAFLNQYTAFMRSRRDACQYVFRQALCCEFCADSAPRSFQTLEFRTSKRTQCVFVKCSKCHYTAVYSCKCTSNRCEFRIECLSMPTHKVPFTYLWK